MTDSNELVHWRGRHADYPVKQVELEMGTQTSLCRVGGPPREAA